MSGMWKDAQVSDVIILFQSCTFWVMISIKSVNVTWCRFTISYPIWSLDQNVDILTILWCVYNTHSLHLHIYGNTEKISNDSRLSFYTEMTTNSISTSILNFFRLILFNLQTHYLCYASKCTTLYITYIKK